jgi:type I restriction enzyme, S subunit
MEKLQPKLRFPEFKEDWQKVKLKDVSSYFNGGSFENDVKDEGKYELITLKSVDMSGNLAHSKRYLDLETPTLKKGTLVMILSEQSPGLLGMTALIPIDNKYVLNQRVAEIRPKNEVASYFLSMAINRNQHYFSKHGAGTKVQNISKPNVENYGFFCPSFIEQTKIATFLYAVDEKLTLLKEKVLF